MRILIQTYHGSKTINRCVERYKELGYDPELIMGKCIIKDNISPNHICYINWMDIFNTIEYNEDLCINQDDG